MLQFHFGGQVAALVSKPHRYICFAGVRGCAITPQIQAWYWAGLALYPQSPDPAAAHTIFAIAAYWGPLVNGSTATMAAAIASLGFSVPPIIPRWLTWLSAIFFLEQVIETVTVGCLLRKSSLSMVYQLAMLAEMNW